jgi:hypothetical protein
MCTLRVLADHECVAPAYYFSGNAIALGIEMLRKYDTKPITTILNVTTQIRRGVLTDKDWLQIDLKCPNGSAARLTNGLTIPVSLQVLKHWVIRE